jgi:hypothetical protein
MACIACCNLKDWHSIASTDVLQQLFQAVVLKLGAAIVHAAATAAYLSFLRLSSM